MTRSPRGLRRLKDAGGVVQEEAHKYSYRNPPASLEPLRHLEAHSRYT